MGVGKTSTTFNQEWHHESCGVTLAFLERLHLQPIVPGECHASNLRSKNGKTYAQDTTSKLRNWKSRRDEGLRELAENDDRGLS